METNQPRGDTGKLCRGERLATATTESNSDSNFRIRYKGIEQCSSFKNRSDQNLQKESLTGEDETN